MNWVNILVGAVLLLFGRRLFWLFVGCVGFLAGFNFASQALGQQSPVLVLLIGIGVGLLGALVSILFQRVVVGIAGFFAGGYFASALAMAILPGSQPAVSLTAFAVGGIVGAILTMALLNPALILLSALAGATAICQNVPMQSSGKAILFIVLLVVGIVVQAGSHPRTRDLPPERPE